MKPNKCWKCNPSLNEIDEKYEMCPSCEKSVERQDPATILAEMAETFKERSQLYQSDYKQIGEIVKILFPNGIALNTAEEHTMYHLFLLQIMKITRFANSGMKHKDSIHDSAVYGAMLESILCDQ